MTKENDRTARPQAPQMPSIVIDHVAIERCARKLRAEVMAGMVDALAGFIVRLWKRTRSCLTRKNHVYEPTEHN